MGHQAACLHRPYVRGHGTQFLLELRMHTCCKSIIPCILMYQKINVYVSMYVQLVRTVQSVPTSLDALQVRVRT